METRTSVLIANTFPLVRNSIRELFDNTPNLQVVACAKAKDEVLALADAHRPQVSILDLQIEWPALMDLVTKLSDRQTPTMVMTDELDESQTFEILRAGANGIISRGVDPDLLCRSVRAVAGGEIWVSRIATSQLVQRFRMVVPADISAKPAQQKERSSGSMVEAGTQTPPRKTFGLTPREMDIVRAIGEAMTNKDIATQLGISEYTVKHHLTKIFDKIGVYSRLELAMMATHHGLANTQVSVGA